MMEFAVASPQSPDGLKLGVTPSIFKKVVEIFHAVDALTGSAEDWASDTAQELQIDRTKAAAPITPSQNVIEEMQNAMRRSQTSEAQHELFNKALDYLHDKLRSTSLSAVIEAKEYSMRLQERVTAAKNAEFAAVVAADELQEENRHLSAETEQLQKKLQEALKDIHRMEDEIADLKSDSRQDEGVQKVIVSKEQTIRRLESEVKVLRSSHITNRIEEHGMEERLARTENRLNEQTLIVNLLDERVQKIRLKGEAALHRAQIALESEKRKNARMQKGIQATERAMRNRVRRVRERRSFVLPLLQNPLEDQAILLRSRSHFFETSLRTDIEQSQVTAQLSEALARLEVENDALLKEIARLRTDLEEVSSNQSKVIQLNAELKLKGNLLQQLRQRISEADASLARKDDATNALRARNESLVEKMAELQTELVGSQGQTQELQNQLADVHSQLEEVQQALEKQREQASQRQDGSTQTQDANTERKPGMTLWEAMRTAAAKMTDSTEQSPPNVQQILHEEIEALQERLELINAKRDVELREARQELDERFENQRQQYAERFSSYQRQLNNMDTKLREAQRLLQTNSEYKKDGNFSSKSNVLRNDQSGNALTPGLPQGEFAITIPGTLVSFRIAVKEFREHNEILLHVATPPQKLTLFNNGKTFRVERLREAKPSAQPVLVDIGKQK